MKTPGSDIDTPMASVFGTLPDGRDVLRLGLRGNGLRIHVLTLGAIVQDLRMEGVDHPLVLSAPQLAPYIGPMAYFGAMVGRFANRIGGAGFSLEGRHYSLARNCHAQNCLHGGPEGSAHQIWDIRAHENDKLRLGLSMPDGQSGFPGKLDVELEISICGLGLQFEITATTDRATPCSFAQHSFYCLDNTGSIAHHQLRIAANAYLPVNDVLIPTGEIRAVTTTEFDFRAFRSLKDVAIDHNFCLSDQRIPLRPVAWLKSEISGLSLELATTEPGLQVYTGHKLPRDGVIGPDGAMLPRYAGIALEPQVWPDAPNHTHFPTSILHPGETYHQITQIRLHHAGS